MWVGLLQSLFIFITHANSCFAIFWNLQLDDLQRAHTSLPAALKAEDFSDSVNLCYSIEQYICSYLMPEVGNAIRDIRKFGRLEIAEGYCEV